MDIPACRCPECFGLAEYMLALTGDDRGLPRAPGHAPLPKPKPPAPTAAEQLRAVPAPVRRVLEHRARPAPQPWEPRPARKRPDSRQKLRPAA